MQAPEAARSPRNLCAGCAWAGGAVLTAQVPEGFTVVYCMQGVEAHLAGLAADHVEALLHRSARMDDLLGRIHFYQARPR